MCFFSIIIPIYNAEKFLEKSLDSVVRQSCQDFQVLLLNDGSTDDSEEICRRYAEKYQSFELISKDNSGVSDTRNVGIGKSEGKYIVFLDSDDFMTENALKALKEKIISNNFPDIVLGNYYTKYTDRTVKGETIKEGMHTNEGHDLEKKIINFNYVSSGCGSLRTVWAKAFSADLIKNNGIKFSKGLRIGEDMAFFLECVCNCKNYLTINDYLYEYVINSTSVMQTMKWNGFNNNLQYLKEVERIKKKYSLDTDLLPVWLEISEKEWLLYSRESKGIAEKYREIKRIMNDKIYKEYSSPRHNAGKFGKLFSGYTFCIRNRLVLPFMFLVTLKRIKTERGVR